MSLPPADGGDDWFLDCGILEDLPAAACGAFPWDASASSSNPRSAPALPRHIDSLVSVYFGGIDFVDWMLNTAPHLLPSMIEEDS